MARTAMQMPRPVSAVEPGAIKRAVTAPLRSAGPLGAMLLHGDDANARAVACSGLGALFLLPVLMLLSVVLGAPLAVPAIIALGFLAASYALATKHRRGAAAINAAVLVGLVAWSLVALIPGEALSPVGLAAALLAPAFAATPAFARMAMAPRSDAAARAAIQNADCLDRLAPNESVIVVRRDATLLAATARARAALHLPADAVGDDIMRRFGLLDRPGLFGAIANAEPGGQPVSMVLQDMPACDNGAAWTAEVAATEAGTVSIRLTEAPAADAAQKGIAQTAGQDIAETAPDVESGAMSGLAVSELAVSDLTEAASFALRRAEGRARSLSVALTSDLEAGLAAHCEPQLTRRIVWLMLERALASSRPGDTLHLTSRTLRSVALLKLDLGSDARDPASATDIGDDFAALAKSLASLLDDFGGTAVADENAAGPRLSVRLQRAAPSSSGK